MSLALGLGPAPEDYEVAWETVRACPGEPSVQQQIRDLVGVADPGEGPEASARLQVHGAVQATDDGFEVRLTLRQVLGERLAAPASDLGQPTRDAVGPPLPEPDDVAGLVDG